MGNSEVGHLNIGAGRVVAQDLVRVGDAVADGSLARESRARAAFAAARGGRGVLHVAGLVSDGGVHSHVDHLRAIVAAALAAGVPRVAVHAFTDGRDVSPHQAADLLGRLERSGPARAPRSRPSSAATTPWIAITASSAPSSRARRSWTGWGSAPSRRPRRSRRAMPRA